jgi:hypothetical protein
MKITNIKPNPNNPRIIKDDKFQKLVQSIKDFPEMMEKRPIVCVTDVDGKIYPLGGNMRFKALKELNYKDIPDNWVTLADDWTEEKRREFVIKDNVGFGEWDWEQLANEWDSEELEAWGLDVPSFETDEVLADEDSEIKSIERLSDKFIVPPFSVLNAREGKWQERKNYWKDLIKDTGITRDTGNQTNTRYRTVEGFSAARKDENVGSVLDPVLSEIIVKWFSMPNSNMFDCFAGDTVFGYVSSYLGNKFTGIELRESQAKFNNERTEGLTAKYICDDGRNVLKHIEQNSQDLLFSCPPYFDLEVYSHEDTQSIKGCDTYSMWVNNFLKPLIELSISHMKQKGWSCWNVHNVGKMKMIDDVKVIHEGYNNQKVFSVTSSKRQTNQTVSKKKNADVTICYSKSDIEDNKFF